MKTSALSILAVAFAAGSASAATYVLDFDANPRSPAEIASLDSSTSQDITNPRIFLDNGVSWEVTTGGGVGAALFDTTCSYGFGTNGCAGDPDLQVFDQSNSDGVSGNVLVQQEAGSVIVDDDARTRRIDLKLLSNITLDWTGVSALDDGFYRFNFGGSELGTIDNGSDSTFDNATASTVFAAAGRLTKDSVISVFFERKEGKAGASGAVDNFVFSIVDDPDGLVPPAVPLPASLPLLFVGAGAFAVMRRRKSS